MTLCFVGCMFIYKQVTHCSMVIIEDVYTGRCSKIIASCCLYQRHLVLCELSVKNYMVIKRWHVLLKFDIDLMLEKERSIDFVIAPFVGFITIYSPPCSIRHGIAVSRVFYLLVLFQY